MLENPAVPLGQFHTLWSNVNYRISFSWPQTRWIGSDICHSLYYTLEDKTKPLHKSADDFSYRLHRHDLHVTWEILAPFMALCWWLLCLRFRWKCKTLKWYQEPESLASLENLWLSWLTSQGGQDTKQDHRTPNMQLNLFFSIYSTSWTSFDFHWTQCNVIQYNWWLFEPAKVGDLIAHLNIVG